jgi:sialate O-acetylesterase
VRIEDYRGNGGFWGSPDAMKLKTPAGNINLAGTWKFRISAADLSVNTAINISPNAKPTLLFNGMIHPLLNFEVLGAIWYQGESNAGQAYRYRTLFPNLIRDWRNQWNNPDLGFYFVQLANYRAAKAQPAESDWAELREAQAMTLKLPKTGMAVAIDIGEANDIHPRNKQDVGKRLARTALHDTYGKDIAWSGPVLENMAIDGPTVILQFNPMDSALLVRDKYGYVKGFAVAGANRVFHWAKGVQYGNNIYLRSEAVDAPVAVRYAWADNPDDANLYNTEGLPAGPFRTDDWPGITADK